MDSRSNFQDAGDSNAGITAAMLQKLERDTRRYVPAAVVPAAAGLAGVLIYTRIFDSADYGRYSLVLASVMIASTLFGGWIQQSILRFLPRFSANQELPAFTSKTFGLVTASCTAVAVVLLVVFFTARPAFEVYARLYLPALALLVSEMVFLNLNTLFQAGLKSRQYAAYKIAAAVFRLGFALGFVFFIKRDIMGLIAGAALGQLLLVLPMARGLKVLHAGATPRLVFDAGFLRTFAAYGIPMVGWMFGGQILNLSDRFIIGAFRGSAEVGVYSANYNLVNVGFGLVTMPFLMAAHPLVMTAWESGRKDEIPGVVRAFSRFYVLAVAPVVAVVSTFSAEITRLLLGIEFREGHTIIPFVLGGAAAWGLAQMGHKGLELKEKTAVMCALVLVTAVANVALNLVFVPRYGYFAAAVTTLVSFLLYPLLVYATVRSHVRWSIPWGTIGRASAASLMTAAGLVAGKRGLPEAVPVASVLFGGVVAGVAVYAALLVVTKEITREELRALMRRSW